MTMLLRALLVWGTLLGVASAQDLDARLGEQVVMIPAGGLTEPTLEMTLFKPKGDGPFLIVVWVVE
jgi:hypothetical protein